MKILLISTLYPPHVIGGAEKAAAELAEGLVRRGHDVVVATLHPGSTEEVESRNGVRVYRLPLDNFYWPFGRKSKPNLLWRLAWHVRDLWNFQAAKRIEKILQTERPDVVHTHCIAGFSVSVWRAVKKRKIRLVHTLYDYYLLCVLSSLFRNGKNCTSSCLDCSVTAFAKKPWSRLPDAVVSVSQSTFDTHVRNSCFSDRRAAVIYNINELAKVRPRPRAIVDNDSNKLVFGFIGKVEQPKGIETLLSATSQLRKDNWKLRVAGTGFHQYLQTLSKRFPDPRIEWLGFTDAADFYSSVDVVIIPSIFADALPLVCVESLHAGKALICAVSGGIPEIACLSDIVEFFPPGDANALAEKMNLALASPQRWRQCSTRNPSVLRPFREAEVVEAYVQEYTSNNTN